jgi:hypothetical protein
MKGSKSRMQGKESLEQATNTKCSVGIDTSKDWLDADVQPLDKRLRVPNSTEGIRKLKRFAKATADSISDISPGEALCEAGPQRRLAAS